MLARLVFLLCLLAAGLVAGFCFGGFYAEHFGQHSGHGLGDLGYLFMGGLIGAPIAAALGFWATTRWTPWQVLRTAALAAAAIAGATWVIVNWFNGW